MRSSVAARLFACLAVVASFTVLASGLGLYAFGLSRGAVNEITRRHLPVVATAHQIAQQAEAIAAAAPMLVVAKTQSQRDTASTRISDQVAWLGELVERLGENENASVAAIERRTRDLVASFVELDKRIQARIAHSVKREEALFGITAAHRGLRGALAAAAAATRGAKAGAGRAARDDPATTLVRVDVRGTAAVMALFTGANATKAMDQALARQVLDQTLTEAKAILTLLPDSVAAGPAKALGDIAAYAIGADDVFLQRALENEAAAAAERFFYAHNQNATALVAATRLLIEAAESDIAQASGGILSRLDLNGNILIALVALCALSSALIAIYLGRRIAGRLRTLQRSMEVHAAGGRDVIPSGGSDEIARMAEALKAFVTAIEYREENLRGAHDEVAKTVRELEMRERDLREAKEEAELANRTKSAFLANMSHELRTPLNAVIGFSDLIRSQAFGPIGPTKYLEYANDINESGQHLLEVINDILDLSKVEAGRIELHEENMDTADAIRSCLALIAERAKAGGLVLEQRFEEPLPMLRVDARKFKQILLNLLSNAVKFTPAGGRVRLAAGADDRGGFVIAVSDTGIGIAPDDMARAMEPFGQVDSNLNRKYEGTGLGLPLTKSLVELHGGSFELDSQVGGGTTATVRLPKDRVMGAGAPSTADRADLIPTYARS